jgi:outer membrane protein OmpA-like peptidoglycan-associated protein
MMRLSLVLGTALTLTACVSSDKVTLLSQSDGGPVGALAILEEDGEETVLDQANLQARLTRGRPRVRELGDVDPAYQDLINSLPPPSNPLVLTGFPTDEFVLSVDQKDEIRRHLSGLASRPGYQVEIRGYTDSMGEEEQTNRPLSQRRAEKVAEFIRSEGFEIAQEDIVGMSEFAARELNGDEQVDPSFRRVEVVIR